MQCFFRRKIYYCKLHYLQLLIIFAACPLRSSCGERYDSVHDRGRSFVAKQNLFSRFPQHSQWVNNRTSDDLDAVLKPISFFRGATRSGADPTCSVVMGLGGNVVNTCRFKSIQIMHTEPLGLGPRARDRMADRTSNPYLCERDAHTGQVSS